MSKPGEFRASLVEIVAIDPDGFYVLACGHRKDPGSGSIRPRRTQCRACFPNAPMPATTWATMKGAVR